jgi:hypothetical protein
LGAGFHIDSTTGSIAGIGNLVVSQNNFDLHGNGFTGAHFNLGNLADGICTDTNEDINFDVDGPCGSGVTVQYSDQNGVRATIPNVNVVCTITTGPR